MKVAAQICLFVLRWWSKTRSTGSARGPTSEAAVVLLFLKQCELNYVLRLMERTVERGSAETDFTVGNVFSFSRGIESDQHMRLFVCVRGVRGTQHNGLIAVS